MPLVRIDLARGRPAQYRKTVGEIVYDAMRETIAVPLDDKFQVITEHAPEELNISAGYLGSTYSADIIIIQMTISIGRTVEKKQALFKRIVEELHRKLGVRPDDVMINIVETTKENWSFGKGFAQYVT